MRQFFFFLISGAVAAELLCASAIGALTSNEPPRDTPLVEKNLSEFSDCPVDALGAKALTVAPLKWRHAETENFIVHYRRVTEAQRVVREIEYDLWFVAKALGATRDRYTKKSHVFIFQDEREWRQFLVDSCLPQWFGSFAHGDELFLHVGGPGEGFSSHTLAHETTHTIVARLYPGRRWPVWLNEGFAEYMGSASIAARKGMFIKSLQGDLQHSDLTLEQLTAISAYPLDRDAIDQLYQSGEKLIRFLMNRFPKDRIVPFVDAILDGCTLQAAVVKVYGDQIKNFDAFEKQYAQFKK